MVKEKIAKKNKATSSKKKDIAIVERRYPYTVAINDFIDGIESIESSLFQVLMRGLHDDFKKKATAFEGFSSKKTKKRSGGKIAIEIGSVSEFEERFRSLRQAKLALENVPKSIFVMLVSHLDNHFKRNLRIIFEFQKELIDGTEKNISISELFEMQSMDEAKIYVLDREMDDILSTRYKYVAWLKNKLKIDIQFDERLFDRLFEVTERRNAFVHSEGCVTQRYVDICKKNKLKFKNEPVIGEKFTIEPDYFAKSFVVIYLIGVVSTHIIWRKLKPGEVEQSDEELNDKIVELLNRERPVIAVELAKFANTLKDHSSEEARLMFIINEALSLKFIGELDKAKELIAKIDWSATKFEFQLAVAIIRDQTKDAIGLMHKIGANREIKGCYKDWPLFMKFRKTKAFVSAYKEIYKEEYMTASESIKDISEPD